ncbi:MAG: bacterio-opsin activator domain-containing protein [Halapricum sp.]
MRVLYVSGDPDARDRVAAGLADAGEDLTVRTAAEADGARDALDADGIDCLVTDHDPPTTDALALLDDLDVTDRPQPVVVFTDSGSERLASDAFAAGANGYLRDEGEFEVLASRLADFVWTGHDAETFDRPPAEQARMFSTLLSNLPGMVYRCRNEGQWSMTFVSDGAVDLCGYPPERIESGEIGWSEDVIHPGDRESVSVSVQEAVDAGDPFTITYRIRTNEGQTRWVWEQGQAVEDERADEPMLEGFITDITEQRERERRLEALFDGTFQFMWLLEPDGTVVEVNEAALEFVGLDREDVVGECVWGTPWWEADAAERLENAVERAAGGEFVRYEVAVQGADEVRTIDFSIQPITDEDGRVTLLVPEGRDVTERRRREEQLEALNDFAGTVTEAADIGEICRAAVETTSDTLGLDLAAVELYDEDEGGLLPCARTDEVRDLVGDDPLFGTDRGEAWQTYVEAEGTIFEGVTTRSDIPTTGTPLDSAIVLPLGRHGVLIAGSTTPESFTDTQIDLARILAAHVETAFDRLDRERSLRDRTEALERKTDRLSTADRVNRVVRAVLPELRGASTRDGIEAGVCQRLAEQDAYRFAWIGTEDPVSGELRPGDSAGREDGYLDGLTLSTTSDESDPEPAIRAFRTQEPQVVDEVRTDPPMAQWRQEALVRDFRSVLAVPITHADARYGVLTLYAADSGQFDDAEQSTLAELGRFVGYAITATQRHRSLSTDSVVELEFQVTDPEQGLFAMLDDLDSPVEFRGVVPRNDEPLRVFLTGQPDAATAIERAGADAPGVSDVRRISETDRGIRYEVTVAEHSTLATVVEQGARVRELTVEETPLRFVVELPANTDVREFAETIERGTGDMSLVARRERDRPFQAATGFRDRVTTELTDRQLEALRTAYFNGFFEWPRAKTGEEIAAQLDVSQPTFNRHLRAGQLAVFELLFEE